MGSLIDLSASSLLKRMQGLTEIEYLQSTGFEYIDTSYIADLETTIEVKIMMTTCIGSGAVLGARSSYNSNAISIWCPNNRNQFQTNYSSLGSVYVEYVPLTAKEYTVSISKNGFAVDGQLFPVSNPASFKTPTGITLFNIAGSDASPTGTGQRYFIGRMYYVKIYQNNELVMDLVPIRIGDTGYMYDKINKIKYNNIGGGKFMLGPDKNPSYEELEYIVCDGTQYLNTEIIGRSGVRVTTKFSAENVSNSTALCANVIKDPVSGITKRFYPVTYNSQKWTSTINNTSSYGSLQSNTIYETDFNSDTNGFTFSVDNELVMSKTEVNTDIDNDLWMFGNHDMVIGAVNGVLSYPFSGKFYGAKIYEDNVLVRDFVPVVSNNTAYMYDSVNDKLYGSYGSSDFIIAPRNQKNLWNMHDCRNISSPGYSNSKTISEDGTITFTNSAGIRTSRVSLTMSAEQLGLTDKKTYTVKVWILDNELSLTNNSQIYTSSTYWGSGYGYTNVYGPSPVSVTFVQKDGNDIAVGLLYAENYTVGDLFSVRVMVSEGTYIDEYVQYSNS